MEGNMEYNDYQVFSVHEKVYYEWTRKFLFFKERRYNGSFEYNPAWIVAKSTDVARDIFEKRFETTELGKCDDVRMIDKDGGFGFYTVKKPTVVRTEFICRRLKPTIKEMQSRLIFSDFMKIFVWYKMGFEELFETK